MCWLKRCSASFGWAYCSMHALEADSNASGGEMVHEDVTLLILYYQSQQTRKMFKNFPEILYVDGTMSMN